MYCFRDTGNFLWVSDFFKHCHGDFNGKYSAIENGR